MGKKTKTPKPEAVEKLNRIICNIHGNEKLGADISQAQLTRCIQSYQSNNNLTLSVTADELGMTQPYLSEVYNGTRTIGTETLKSLGLVKEVIYRRWR